MCAFIDPSSPSTTACTPVSHVFPSNPSLKSVDPRVGIAWDPFKDQKTSIRAGAGVFHDPIQVRNYHPTYIFSAPYQTAVSGCVFGGSPCSYPVSFQGITVPTPTIGEALEYDPGTTPFILQYNFGIQHELGKSTVLSVSYDRPLAGLDFRFPVSISNWCHWENERKLDCAAHRLLRATGWKERSPKMSSLKRIKSANVRRCFAIGGIVIDTECLMEQGLSTDCCGSG